MGLTMSSFCATFINFPQSDIRRIFYPLCTFPSPLKQQPRVSAAENPPFPLPFLPRTIKIPNKNIGIPCSCRRAAPPARRNAGDCHALNFPQKKRSGANRSVFNKNQSI